MHTNGVRGLIFSIDRFASEDGPGMRTTVFLKGCPLRCVWCHSPQSQGAVQPRLTFYKSRCISCGLCTRVCRQKAQVVTAEERKVDWKQCDNCFECVKVCPTKAMEIAGEWMTVEQTLDIIRRDIPYYTHSGGGVTFSGGEATLQAEFLTACLRESREMNVHTCLDTSGFASWSVFEKIAPYVNLYLYDFKQADNKKHKQFTGVENDLILDNLRKIAALGKPIWIRVPLIPHYNDSLEDIKKLAEMVKPLKSVEKVTLLPYNEAAGAKYEIIGHRYRLPDTPSQSDEEVSILAGVISQMGIPVEIGR
jgi:pyruvate formate lyase activating enzyme